MTEKPLYSEVAQGYGGLVVLSLRQLKENTFCLEVGQVSGGAYPHAQLIVSQGDLFLIGAMIHRYGLSTNPPEKPLAKDEGNAGMPRDGAK
ncbi:MAG TPA: hypothetical protein VHR45_16640 [Thermoanaerobaculia bacterium]|nr:hypothetical protein [Thermoanaerobaculia bacterium]